MAIGTKELLAALKIDPEFEDKIPPLTEDEFKQLRENILEVEEVYEPIRVWNGTVVDGHNRLKVIRENPDVKWSTRDMAFTDKWAAFEWMYKNQLGRRNLTDAQRTMLIGKMYEARKNAQGGDRRSEEFSNGQNVHLKDRREVKDGTAGEIGREFGMDGRSVRRAEKFAKGVDALKETSPEAANKVLSGRAKVNKTDIAALATATEEEVEKAAKDIIDEKPIEVKKTPKKKPNIGRPTETRELMDTIGMANQTMRSYDEPSTFNIHDLIEEIEVNGAAYVNSLRNTISIRTDLLDKNDEAKQLVFNAIAKVIQDIIHVRGEYTK